MRLILIVTVLLGAYIWFKRNKGVKNTPQGRLNHTEIFDALLTFDWDLEDDPW